MGDYISGAPDGGQQALSLADRLKAMMDEYGVAPDGGQQTSSPADRLNAMINGYGTQAAIGVRKGVSSILGLPVDLASLPVNAGIWALNKTTGVEVPYVTNPVGGSKQLDERCRRVAPRPSWGGRRKTRSRVAPGSVSGADLARKLVRLQSQQPAFLGRLRA